MNNIEQLKETIKLGIIGGGDMGCLYAKTFIKNNWKNVYICDLPHKYDMLVDKLKDSGITVLENGHLISRCCDVIFYSVEAENLAKVVQTFGNSTKMGAIVAGQTSVKTIEIQAFEKYLPKDVEIITCHSMHGPTVDPKDQPLALIPYRNSEQSLLLMREILSGFNSKLVELTYQKHDEITADTQAVTHLAFISMGTAWKTRGIFPWETQSYVGGIENVKVNIALRIFSNKWHVYAGLAIYNPSAKSQIQQYTRSVSDLFLLMIEKNEVELRKRINSAKEYVFGEKFKQFDTSSELSNHLLLSDKVLDQFSLTNVPEGLKKPNSHLSLLAMVDCWYQCKINPYHNMICQTPLFRLWLGIAEFLFFDQKILNETIECALNDHSIKTDDLCFYSCAQSWSECIDHGIMEFYQKKFENTRDFFEPRLAEASSLSSSMIKTISNNIKN